MSLIKSFKSNSYAGKSATNNTLESIHSKLKGTYTDGTKLRTGNFLHQARTIVRDFSLLNGSLNWDARQPDKRIWEKCILLLKDQLYTRLEECYLFIRSSRETDKQSKRLK